MKIYPDFPTGGLVDVSDYQGGKRGGKIKVRAKLEKIDNSTVAVRDLPYGGDDPIADRQHHQGQRQG